MGRRPIHRKPMTPAQRQRRRRDKLKREQRIIEGAAKRERRDAREIAMAEKTRLAARLIRRAPLYGVIYADPPWRFEPRSRITGMDRAADNHYPTMRTEDVCALRLPAAGDCALFLWATQPMLEDALQVMRAWGFAYKSGCIWTKDRIGTGYWWRSEHELLLLGTRGEVPAPAPGTQFRSLIAAPLGPHSVKPPAFAEMIERMFPNVPKLEMFARRSRPGWDAWGAEVPSEAENAAIAAVSRRTAPAAPGSAPGSGR